MHPSPAHDPTRPLQGLAFSPSRRSFTGWFRRYPCFPPHDTIFWPSQTATPYAGLRRRARPRCRARGSSFGRQLFDAGRIGAARQVHTHRADRVRTEAEEGAEKHGRSQAVCVEAGVENQERDTNLPQLLAGIEAAYYTTVRGLTEKVYLPYYVTFDAKAEPAPQRSPVQGESQNRISSST